MPLVLTVAPTAEPLALEEAKAHLRVTATDEDSLIGNLIAVARDRVETHTRRALVTRTYKWLFDAFPRCGVIEFPVYPVRKVDYIKYVDTGGVQQTWSTSDYRLDLVSEHARLSPEYGKTWPFTRGIINAVEIQFVAGYATPATADAGADTLTASPSHVYANTDPVEISNSGGAAPGGLAALTTYYARDVAGAVLKLAATSGGSAIDITSTGTGRHFLGRIPEPIKQAMLLLIEHLHRNRSAVTDFENFEMPIGVEGLLAPYAIMRF